MNDKNLYDELFNNEAPDTSLTPKSGLSRSANNFIISGVCGGIASFTNKDVKLIRFITLLVLLIGWFPFFVYLILSFLLPVEKQKLLFTHEEIVSIDKENTTTIIGSLLFLVGLHFVLKSVGVNSFLNSYLFQNQFIFFSFALVIGGMIMTEKIKLPKFYFDKEIKFTISKNQKVVFGVCAGLAEYLTIDVLLLRTIFVVITFLTLGLFIIFYLLIYFFFNISKDRIND